MKIARYRWTTEEKKEVLDQLLQDPDTIEAPRVSPEQYRLASIHEYEEEAEERYQNLGKMTGLSTGYDSLDRITKGLVGGELIIVSGRTSVGKTQLATNIVYRLAQRHIPSLFITLEMTKVELTSRFKALGRGNISGLPIFYQLSNELDYRDISPLIERAKEDGAELVVIDHLHYFSREIEFQTNEIGKIVKEFKRAAIDNDLPIMLLCHVRKAQGDDRKKVPELDDLRDSSFIAQDADIVLMVWRDLDHKSEKNEVQVVIQKNRNRGLFAGERIVTLWPYGVELSEFGETHKLD